MKKYRKGDFVYYTKRFEGHVTFIIGVFDGISNRKLEKVCGKK